ncbi:KUP/HAK/KT family potassium transporter [Agriterribacter sp.]|uniref:KUP/HAK/KT family potassium transporter n=1 Tax=Agriterribacter sp. TaxID=2821509 RepID=UPI002D1D627F|nr:KUP/HAK/KT family potassium transporter [Agriterribacter sp.]HTN07935.1 KUP/HAK/KT family potassium transporter [Agriterribacter sp.]
MSLHNKVSFAGLLIALGIIYGDIGTSPLYVLNAITSGKTITGELVTGALSLIIWTLTLQTTIKYVILTLNADNRGEGGIFSLFALVRRRRKWLVIAAMIGGAALLADGMITPPISVTSAVEGLKQIPVLSTITQSTIVYIVISILTVLFFIQQFGTAFIGRFFGPVMFCWFIMLAVLGIIHLSDDIGVLKAFNPYYGIKLLVSYPRGFYILGGVFLCTTGAEALYSDLGHCGKWNIRYSWVFVKTCLIMNYLGQGAWLLSNYRGRSITAEMINAGFNPFYGLMPHWFLYFGIAIATAAAIIASQALISGSFTLISEAMRLNLWPKLRIHYPTEARGQLFIPAINGLLYAGCIGIVLYFQKAANMEAAYGLAITLCMIATSILFANYLVLRRVKRLLIYVYLSVFLTIELSFLFANIQKFPHGGYVALVVGGLLFLVMFTWFKARKIKNRYVEFVRLEQYIPMMQELSNDRSVPKYATHLVYLTSADNVNEIEHKIIYSILNRSPKRADIYWFVHIDTMDDPYTCEYKVAHIIPNDIIRIDFKLGFRVAPRINLMFRKVVEDLVVNKEVNIATRYERVARSNTVGDFQFMVMEKYMSQDNELPFMERLIMKMYFWLKNISLSEERGFGLDPGNVIVEKFPLIVGPVTRLSLKRVKD